MRMWSLSGALMRASLLSPLCRYDSRLPFTPPSLPYPHSGDRILCEKMDATIASVTTQHEPMPDVVPVRVGLVCVSYSLSLRVCCASCAVHTTLASTGQKQIMPVTLDLSLTHIPNTQHVAKPARDLPRRPNRPHPQAHPPGPAPANHRHPPLVAKLCGRTRHADASAGGYGGGALEVEAHTYTCFQTKRGRMVGKNRSVGPDLRTHL